MRLEFQRAAPKSQISSLIKYSPMPKSRITRAPVSAPYWKKEGKLYFVERADLEKAIQDSGATEYELKSKMGQGYDSMLEALEGKRIEGWTAYFIETQLTP